MKLGCARNKHSVILGYVYKGFTAGPITILFIPVCTNFALLSSCIGMNTSQAIIHISWSFSAQIHLFISALSNTAVIIQASRSPTIDLFQSILDIIIVPIFVVKEANPAHLAAVYITLNTILPEVNLAINALNFGGIVWV